MHNSSGNLASQMQLQLLRPSNHAPNETQQTRIKLGLSKMQEELPVIADGPANPYPLSMKLRDKQPNKR